MALGSIFLDGDRRGVRFERDLDATPEEVWRAIGTPEGVSGWLAPALRWELAPGERWEVAFGDGRASGRVVAVEPLRLVELTWSEGKESESVLRIELHAHGGRCRLVLEHTRLDPESAPGYGAGWQSHLEALEAVVTGRDAGGDDAWWTRYAELRPAYEELASAL